MSDPMRALKVGARQLRNLVADVKPLVFARQDWVRNVFARRTLGDGVEVEPWYLADYFLLAWRDWSALKMRIYRYFGRPDKPMPNRWDKLERDCAQLTNDLFHDGSFLNRVSEFWFESAAANRNRETRETKAKRVLSSVIQNYRRWTLVHPFDVDKLYGGFGETQHALIRSDMAQKLQRVTNLLNRAVLLEWEQLPAEVLSDVRTFLRNYCHANLIVSWLSEVDVPCDFPDLPALFLIRVSERPMPTSKPNFLDQIQDNQVQQLVGRVLERVERAVAEIGYEDFFEDVTSGNFQGGDESPIGSDQVNLIPSEFKGPCQPVLLAVSRGDKKSLGFTEVMRKVRRHLIDCPNTKAVVVICDHWKADMLDEHLGDLKAHHARGVRFLFQMVGTPGLAMAPVAVDLG